MYQYPSPLNFDDMIAEKAIESIVEFTPKAHHWNSSIIYLQFDRAHQHRPISLNAHYLMLYKNTRNKSQITVQSWQLNICMCHVMSTYYDATCTSIPHWYLLVDLIPLTPDELRLRGQMFDTLTVYVSRKYIYIYWTYKGAILIWLKNSLTKEKKLLRHRTLLHGEREPEKRQEIVS